MQLLFETAHKTLKEEDKTGRRRQEACMSNVEMTRRVQDYIRTNPVPERAPPGFDLVNDDFEAHSWPHADNCVPTTNIPNPNVYNIFRP